MQFDIEKNELLSNDTMYSYIQFIKKIRQDMPDKTWFAMDDDDVIMKRFQEKTAFVYTAKESETGRLAGIFMVTVPGLSEENLGHDLGFSEEDLLKSVHMDTAVILPDYRGNGLQARLMEKAEADCTRQGYVYLLCTIHPENRFSLQNARKLGYQVVKTTFKYGGLPRNILCKTL